MVNQLNKAELESLIEAIRRGPSQVIGFDRGGQNQKDFEMGWNAAKDQVWSALCAIKSKQEAPVFEAIDAAADNFAKLHGDLNENSNFDLYGQQLEQAVIEFNKQNGTEYLPDAMLKKWFEDGQQRCAANLEDDDMRFMNEALENWNNLKAGLKE
ncbi:hypothetical protein [Rheinheimera hassiensis]|uniref:hypothetical protein n=1 Tax=Rheinheimera hassiensis TaxID=1193627 RepID=UPI001F06F17F|nr:hypothetical protein [Rheinheimera hassiensis]